MYCIQCGTMLADEARFCHRCGAAVPEEVAQHSLEVSPAPAPAEGASAPPTSPPPPPTSAPPVIGQPIILPGAAGPTAPMAPPATVVPPTPVSPPMASPSLGASPPGPVAPPAVTPPPVTPAQPMAPAAGWTPITTNAQAGPNIVSFPGVSEALDVAEGLVEQPEQTQKLGVDQAVAHSLHDKLRATLDFLAREHGGTSVFGQAMNVLKRAGGALMRRQAGAGLLTDLKPDQWLATLDLTAAEAQLYNLCARQGELRQGLELRLLRTCRSCRNQRVINPDYEKMMQKNKQWDALFAMRTSLLLAIFKMRRDPRYVCPRCQGLDYSDRTIVLCPQCGTPNTDVLLARCSKCGYDFVTRSAGTPPPPRPPGPGPGVAPNAPPQPVPAPAEPSAPSEGRMLTGKCKDCGATFRIPLEKIPEQGLKGKCSKCGRKLILRRPVEKAP